MLTITPANDPVLWKKTDPLHLMLLPMILEQAKEMRRLMVKHGGVGLAAPQVSIPLRYFITNGRHLPSVVLNPEIVEASDLMETAAEGCLTWPNLKPVLVKRPRWIVATFQNALGTTRTDRFTGLSARIFCHETDHLNGVCIHPHP